MTKKDKNSKVKLSTPWGDNNIQYMENSIKSSVGPYFNIVADIEDNENAELFIKERTRLHELYIKEQEKTKRISLILAVVLVIISVFLLIFAPKGKETLSYIVCGVLFVFAAGAVGYKRIWGKIPFTEFGAE